MPRPWTAQLCLCRRFHCRACCLRTPTVSPAVRSGMAHHHLAAEAAPRARAGRLCTGAASLARLTRHLAEHQVQCVHRHTLSICAGGMLLQVIFGEFLGTHLHFQLCPSPKLQLKVAIELLQASRAHSPVSRCHHHVQQRPLLGRQPGHGGMAAAPLRAPPRCASRWQTRRRTSSFRLPSCRCAK